MLQQTEQQVSEYKPLDGYSSNLLLDHSDGVGRLEEMA